MGTIPPTQYNQIIDRAAQFVTRIYERYASVSDMLQHLQWDTLENKRNTEFPGNCNVQNA